MRKLHCHANPLVISCGTMLIPLHKNRNHFSVFLVIQFCDVGTVGWSAIGRRKSEIENSSSFPDCAHMKHRRICASQEFGGKRFAPKIGEAPLPPILCFDNSFFGLDVSCLSGIVGYFFLTVLLMICRAIEFTIYQRCYRFSND